MFRLFIPLQARISVLAVRLAPAIVALSLCTFPSCRRADRPAAQGPVPVKVLAVDPVASLSSTDFSGTVEAAETTPVSFSVPGTIVGMYVDEGQRVAKGQLIARIKSASLVNSANIARAELEQARDAYNRLKKLHDADALPDIKWVEVQAKLRQAENAAEMADRAVTDATIHAPVAGVVSRKLADVGETVISAQPIVEIVGVDGLKIAISVPENEISAIVPGSSATVVIPALDSLRVDGRNAVKSVVADPLTRAFTVRYDIPNPSRRILPGMIGDVDIALQRPDSAAAAQVMLPPRAVLLDSDNRYFVWLVSKARAERRFVSVASLQADGVVVSAGIARGDSVIIDGMQKVSTGTPVIATR